MISTNANRMSGGAVLSLHEIGDAESMRTSAGIGQMYSKGKPAGVECHQMMPDGDPPPLVLWGDDDERVE